MKTSYLENNFHQQLWIFIWHIAYQIKDLRKSFPMAYHMRDLDLQRGRYDDLKISARRKSLQRQFIAPPRSEKNQNCSVRSA